MPNVHRRSVPEISDAREAAIQAGIANDPDNPEIAAAEFARMRPASEMLPPALYAKLVTRGRPKAEVTKTAVKLRLDPEIVDTFRRTGNGWQTRINVVLARAARALREGKSSPVMARADASKAMAKKTGKTAASAKTGRTTRATKLSKSTSAPRKGKGASKAKA